MPSKRIIFSIILMIIGFPLILLGWYIYDPLNIELIDQGGTIAMIGNLLFLTGAGIYAYKYKLRRNEPQQSSLNTKIEDSDG